MDAPNHQLQFSIPGKAQTYLFTCTGNPEAFAKNEAAFRQVISSVTLSAGMGAFWYSLPSVVRYIVIIILILVLVLIVWLISRKKKK